jgi:hypothetical protein
MKVVNVINGRLDRVVGFVGVEEYSEAGWE